MAKKAGSSTTPSKRKVIESESTIDSDTFQTSQIKLLGADADDGVSSTLRERVPKINTSSLAELKNTCDDVVKEFFARPGAFTRSHVHEDVRLVLGWSSVLVAAATGYYGYIHSFEESKAFVTAGVLVYMFLSAVMTIYITYFEKQVIFEGKRRTFAARISTEKLSVSSSAASTPRQSTGVLLFPFSLIAPSSSPSTATSAASSKAKASTTTSAYPSYTLSLDYVHSSNHGKALIHQASTSASWCFGDFFDVEGRLAKSALEKQLAKLLADVVGK